jgi:hypothetical protein
MHAESRWQIDSKRLSPLTAMPSKTEPFGVDDEHYLGLCFVVTCALQLSCFAVAYTCEFDLITDFAGSTNFVLLAVSAYACHN